MGSLSKLPVGSFWGSVVWGSYTLIQATYVIIYIYTPPKTNMDTVPKIAISERRYIKKNIILGIYASFRGCMRWCCLCPGYKHHYTRLMKLIKPSLYAPGGAFFGPLLLGYGPGQSGLQSAKLTSNCMYMVGCKLSTPIKRTRRIAKVKQQITNYKLKGAGGCRVACRTGGMEVADRLAYTAEVPWSVYT